MDGRRRRRWREVSTEILLGSSGPTRKETGGEVGTRTDSVRSGLDLSMVSGRDGRVETRRSGRQKRGFNFVVVTPSKSTSLQRDSQTFDVVGTLDPKSSSPLRPPTGPRTTRPLYTKGTLFRTERHRLSFGLTSMRTSGTSVFRRTGGRDGTSVDSP